MAKLSPMMEQYFEIKEKHPGCILFFRLGDFYEMFYEDAKTASRELELTLTGKNCGQEERAPMCGVPFHSADTYIARLVEKGYKVAICEQVEDPALAKGLVKREVIRIVTPGTLTEQSMLDQGRNNYLASLASEGGAIGFAYCDISTGELAVTEMSGGSASFSELLGEINRLEVRELILSRRFADDYGCEELKAILGTEPGLLPDEAFSLNNARDLIEGQLGKGAAARSGLTGRDAALSALKALFTYLLDTQKQSLRQLLSCRWFDIGTRMPLDKATLRNLEITETLYDKKIKGSLLGILDRTGTAMGSRLLKRWLKEPLNDSFSINERLDGVEELYSNDLLLNDIRVELRDIYDFERLISRVAAGTAGARDLMALSSSCAVLPLIKGDLMDCGSSILLGIADRIADLSPVTELIDSSIDPDAPPFLREGGLILDGYSPELDSLKDSIKDAKIWIAGLEGRERERTGIKNLKVGFNKVFGYYIDVTRSNSDLVPDDYIRKQTLVNNERYITPELKEMENLVLNAESKINKLEYEIFSRIRSEVETYIGEIQRTSHAVAELDVLCSYAYVSRINGYVKPVVDDGMEIAIEEGRHPVIEQTEGQGRFVSNDTYLNCTDTSLAVITGPNMAGKSTYMRQTALIVLMAQTGCFVPCRRARIGVVDRIFTRIGASDNLSQGQSTFYVEMSELSYILSCARERSLIILDEIGRGTSTYDGLSIAWATAEYLTGKKRRIRTLFATHYHELTALADERPGIVNLSVDVAEEGGEIVFLHKIVSGAASRSYGIHVAKLAGIPSELLSEAENRLSDLERSKGEAAVPGPDKAEAGSSVSAGTGYSRTSSGRAAEEGTQLSLFMSSADAGILERIRDLDIMEITPGKAIDILTELQKELNSQAR
ncbi:MAG: DNA mismatch repair protein MutS [Eubacterium sp.]|nr:DNA mismatch repair protein MutS [Eubacterium sp.]